MLNKGVPITDVARWLGHRDVRVTYRIYGHLVPSAASLAIAVLDEEYAEWTNPKSMTHAPQKTPVPPRGLAVYPRADIAFFTSQVSSDAIGGQLTFQTFVADGPFRDSEYSGDVAC